MNCTSHTIFLNLMMFYCNIIWTKQDLNGDVCFSCVFYLALTWFFFMKFSHCPKIILKKYQVTNSLIFVKKFGRIPNFLMKNSHKITRTTYNMKGCSKFVYFHSLNIAQFVVDDCQLKNITKLGKDKIILTM